MSGRLIAVVLICLLTASVAAGQTEDFYQARLEGGYEAFRARRFSEAVDQLRIAAFGLMDRPVLLTEALVRLTLAQQAVGSKEGVAEAINRFVEVERRFGGFAEARLETPARTPFRGLLASHAPAATIASLPSFGGRPPTSGPRQAVPPSVPAAVNRLAEPAPAGAGRAAPEVGEADVPPRYRLRITPEYPAEALRAGVGGIVLLRVLVSETGGEPLKVEVVREVRPDLAEAAVSAVKRWTFEPARKDGVPVEASLTVPIRFQMSEPSAATPR